jgi:hypothetical protein
VYVPSLVEAFQLPLTLNGTIGVIELDAEEAAEVPFAFVAVTVNV